MLNLIDSIKHDMDAAEKNPADRVYHCTRITVAALQLAQLLKTDYPTAYTVYLQAFLDDAFEAVARHNGD